MTSKSSDSLQKAGKLMMTISFDLGLHFSVNNIPKVRRRDGTEDLKKTLGIV